MKPILIVLGAWLALVPTLAAAHEARALGWVNLRLGPARAALLLARLPPATRLTVESCTPHADWCQVIAPGERRGWVYAPNMSYPLEEGRSEALPMAPATMQTVAQKTRVAVLIMPANLQAALITATGYTDGALEVSPGDHQITVTVINAALNAGNRPERQAEAARIAAAVAREIAQRPDLTEVLVIHVDFIRRTADSDDSGLIQAVDFRRQPNGRFVLHMT